MSLSLYSSDSEFANRVLNSLTDDERGYFIACTDIFHDKQYNVNGRPSESAQLQNTIVLNLTKTITGSDFGVAGNWDVNITSLPFITTQVMAPVIDDGFSITPGPAASLPTIGGVTCLGGPTGVDLPYNTAGAANFTNLNANLAVFPTWSQTSSVPVSRPYYQILSMGLEIINATPELYRGGNLIRYRVPTQGRSVPLALYNTTPGSPYTAWPLLPRENFRCYPLPPSSAALASQYPDSVIDEAMEGSYQMHTIQDDVSDFYCAGNERVFFSSPNPSSGGTPNALISASTIGTSYDYDPPLIRGDFDMVGTYFTGLTPQSILTLRYRVILSQVPSSSDTFLSSLSKMSPPANQELDTLISKVQTLFLPGIRAGMNPGGEWWKTVVRGLGKVAKSTGKSALKTVLNGGLQVIKQQVPPSQQQAFNMAVSLAKDINKQRKNKKGKPSTNKSKVVTTKVGTSGALLRTGVK